MQEGAVRVAKIKKKMLDIGPGKEQVGLNVTQDTETRQLVSLSKPQTIVGEKTFSVPPRSNAYPVMQDDAVSKKVLLESTRCVTGTITDVITVTAEDIQNGYVSLSKSIAPGKTASLEIIEFEGASGLALNQDFGIVTNPDGSVNKLQWQGWPLGRPGMLIEGQRMVVRYNTCKKSLYGTPDISNMFMARVEDKADPESFINEHLNKNYIVTVDDSEKHLELIRLSNGETIRIKLPQITGSSGLGLTCAGGKLLLYSTPVPQIEDIGGALCSRYPFATGAFNVYEHDGNGWVLKLTDDMHDEFEALKDVDLVDPANLYPLLMDVVPVGKEDLGLYMSWRSVAEHTGVYEQRGVDCVAALKIFGKDYQYKTTKQVALNWEDNRAFNYGTAVEKYHVYSGPFLATDRDFVPSCDGLHAYSSASWPTLGQGLSISFTEGVMVPLSDNAIVSPELSVVQFIGMNGYEQQFKRKQLGTLGGVSSCISFVKGNVALFHEGEYSSEQYLGLFDADKCELIDLRGAEAFTHYKNAKQQGYRGALVLNL